MRHWQSSLYLTQYHTSRIYSFLGKDQLALIEVVEALKELSYTEQLTYSQILALCNRKDSGVNLIHSTNREAWRILKSHHLAKQALKLLIAESNTEN